MKRYAFFFFAIVALALIALPDSQAARKSSRRTQVKRPSLNEKLKSLKRKYRPVNPHEGYHEGFLDRIDPVMEASRATREVSSRLPRKPGAEAQNPMIKHTPEHL